MTAPPDLVAALGPVVDALDALGVDYLVGGSLASSVHGTARATMDVDLVAQLEAAHVEPFVAALGDAYYVDEAMIREALRDRSSFNLVHHATVLKIDVFLPKDRPYDTAALARRRPDTLDDAPGARPFFIASPEDVVLAKLEWYETGGRVSERQWGDVLGVLRVKQDVLDNDYLSRWAKELGIHELLERALSER